MTTTIGKVLSVPEAFEKMANMFRERNAVYGSTYKDFGKVLMALRPQGYVIETEEDANRLGILIHVADKLARYCRQFHAGGHPDSLDDLSVYAQLLQECDSEYRARAEKIAASRPAKRSIPRQPGSTNGANGMKPGDRVGYSVDGRSGVAFEFFQDGDAHVTFDGEEDLSLVKWCHLSPEKVTKEGPLRHASNPM